MKLVKKITLSTALALTMSLSNAEPSWDTYTPPSILQTYANIATVSYANALRDAKVLRRTILRFTRAPSTELMDAAKASWLISRESYGQTEIFRLSNGPIDAELGWVEKKYGALEGQINAWPLDENMIDYTINANSKRTKGNIIDGTGMFTPVGKRPIPVDITTITKETLRDLNENGGDANVATGYHAIEFLLWGQDQDYSSFVTDRISNGALTAGQRPLTDFTKDKFADRRKQYLNAATSLLIDDLETLVRAWADNSKINYKAALLGRHVHDKKNIDEEVALRQIFSGMGTFIKSELANERIAVAVLTPSEEDEQSCFSDNTHRDITMNYQGFKNVLFGTYDGVDFGDAPIDAMKHPSTLMTIIASVNVQISRMNAVAQVSRHFDYQIRPHDSQANELRRLKNGLRAIGDQMLHVAKDNGIKMVVRDVTDGDETKF